MLPNLAGRFGTIEEVGNLVAFLASPILERVLEVSTKDVLILHRLQGPL